MRSIRFLLISIVSAAILNVPASDWPHWLGASGDNTAPEGARFEPDLNKWKVVWKAEVGKGYSSIAVAGESAYTVGHDGKGKETIYCLNAATGAEHWKYSYDAPLMPHLHTGGPNATPTIAGGKVISLSKNGQVYCLTDKGDLLWKNSLLEVFGIKLPEWGFASSPVIDGKQLLFCGGKACALDLDSGKPIWVSKTARLPAGYSTLPVFELGGKKFVAALDGKGFSILSATTGDEITRHPFKALFDMNATTPFILDQGKRIFISNTVQSDMLAFDGQKLTTIWSTKELRNTMNNSVFQAGAIYGISGEQEQSTNSLVCLSEADGTEKWSQPNIGYGNVIGIGKTLLVLTERGLLMTVKIDPAQYTELSRRQVLEKVCWTTPTYANERIYLRNDQGNVLVLGQ
jgi:outer membrane protein assembly factor BamB